MIIFFIPWVVGWILTLHPIYSSLMRASTRRVALRRRQGYTSETELVPSDVVFNIILATILSLGWFLAIPFYTSHFLRSRHKPVLEKEIEIFTDEHAQARELKNRIAKANREIEISSYEWEDN